MVIFLTAKNALVLALQVYRLCVLHCTCYDHKENDFSPDNEIDANSRLSVEKRSSGCYTRGKRRVGRQISPRAVTMDPDRQMAKSFPLFICVHLASTSGTIRNQQESIGHSGLPSASFKSEAKSSMKFVCHMNVFLLSLDYG